MNCGMEQDMSGSDKKSEKEEPVNVFELFMAQVVAIPQWLNEDISKSKSSFYSKVFGIIIGMILPVVAIAYGLISSNLLN